MESVKYIHILGIDLYKLPCRTLLYIFLTDPYYLQWLDNSTFLKQEQYLLMYGTSVLFSSFVDMNFYQNVLCTVTEISFSAILFQKALLEMCKGCDNLPILSKSERLGAVFSFKWVHSLSQMWVWDCLAALYVSYSEPLMRLYF